LLSYQIATGIKARKLAPVLASFEPEPLPVSMVYGGGPALLPLKVRAFLDFAAPKLRKALAARAKRPSAFRRLKARGPTTAAGRTDTVRT